MIFLKYLNYTCKIKVIPKTIHTQNCFYLVIHFLSTTNVIFHPLNAHFSTLIPRSDSFEKSYEQLEHVSKTINKNTRATCSCFHTSFSRVWIPGETLALVVHILHIKLINTSFDKNKGKQQRDGGLDMWRNTA